MVPPSKTTRTVQELMAQVSVRWQAGDLTGLENALRDLCDEAKLSGEVSPGLNRGLPSLGLASWRTLLEIAEAASMTPGSVAADHVLALMHAFSAGAVVGSPAAASKEVGCAVDMLCAYIDSILVPLVLRQPALRSDAAQCPCERCLGAAQAVRGLTASQDLRELTEAIAFPFLFSVLEMAAKAQLEGEVEEGSGHPRVAQAAEALAVLGTYARLQEERWHFEVPPNVVHAIVFLLRTGRRHGGAPSPPRPLMLQVLHVVRNVSANHAEVMQLTAEVFSESGNQLWAALEAWPAQEAAPKAPKEHRAEGPRRRRREAAAPDAATDVERKLEQQPLVAEAVAAAFGGGNPQESDEQESSAEVGPHPGARKDEAEVETLQTSGAQADGSIGTASGSEDTATSAPPVPAARARCAELLSLYSLVLQALFQTDEALQQRLFVSEEAIRLQMVIVARALRTSELLPKWQERLAFQGIRMYLLVCRSSHIRKQYVVLQSAFIEEERRAVAYLLSLTPAAQRCCVLLRAMAQDVHSWLLWQSQASARAEPVPRPPAAPRLRDKDGQPKARESTRRRRETGDSSEGAADSPAAARSAAKGRRSSEASGKSQPPPPPPPGPRPPASRRRSSKAVKAARAAAPAVAFEDLCDTMRFAAADDGGSGDAPYVVTEPEPPAPERMFDEEALSLVNLFNGGEAVWLIHSLMVLLIALVLVAWWYSLETPNQPMSIEAMYQFWRKNS